MNEFKQRALKLASMGFTVMPLDGKKPVLNGWQTLRNVTVEQIETWDKAGLWRNIGLVTGSASNNTVVIDFDGLPAYKLFCGKFPALVNTRTVATGSGKGMHCYYRVDVLPSIVEAKNLDVDGEKVNIEIKADGRQVVMPPSVHPETGQPYTYAKDIQSMHLKDLSEVAEWLAELKRELTPWKPPQMALPQRSGELNPKLLDAVEMYFRAQPHKEHGEWINCACPNTSNHKHGDREWSFGYNVRGGFGHCFNCSTMNLKALCERIGINPQDYGGLYEQTDVRIATPRAAHSTATYTGDTTAPQPLSIIQRNERLSHYQERYLDYDTPRADPPVVFPLRCLHPFGGMAKVGQRGKLIGIAGVSGGGKTSLLESMVDGFLRLNVPCLIWSPEWTPDEFVARAVQRYGGARLEDLYMHEVFIWEQQNGITHGVGVEMSESEQDASTKAVRELRQWQTQVGYIDEPTLNLARLKECLPAALAGLDYRPGVLIIDYVQLFHALETNADLTMYNLLMQLKAECAKHKLQGVIASQVTKDSARGAANGAALDALAARYVNDDAFNLFITINPDRDADGRFMDTAVLNVAKNSYGQRGKLRVAVNWQRMFFDDKAHANQSFGEEG